MKADYDMPSAQKAKQKLGQTAARITADYLQVASNKVITPGRRNRRHLANRDARDNKIITAR